MTSPAVSELRPAWLEAIFNDRTLVTHKTPLPAAPELLHGGFSRLADQLDEGDTRWWEPSRVALFVDSLSSLQRQRLDSLRAEGAPVFRTAYRRMRDGVPRWEVRQDDIAGCLRTARGGSSKQAVVRLGGGVLRIRWMTPSEYAKLMGAQDFNLVNVTESAAYNGFGDAVCVPVVRWLATHCLQMSSRTDRDENRVSSR
jgi:DNA (cytosine-5)-methyltransferase 1